MTKSIVKRDGNVVPFDKSKIERAIGLSLGETSETIEWSRYEEMLAEICDSVKDGSTVEQVQDTIEKFMMKYKLYESAKRYILFRKEKDTERELDDKKYVLLSKDFLSKYKHIEPPMTQLGNLVYYRTYSRFLDKLGRREYWWETVRRAVEYNCSLIKTSKEEAEKLFDNIFYLRQFLSGRTLWVGGETVSKKFPMSNYNCSFQVIDEFESFRDIFYLLLIGSGAGIRILKSDVAKLPKVRTNVKVFHKDYEPAQKQNRKDSTSLLFEEDYVEITVGDSKEGWVQALDYFLKIHWSKEYSHVNSIIFNYDNVRPKGEKLKTFGGTASGHTALYDMFKKIEKFIKRNSSDSYKKLKPIDCLDISNAIGGGVVVGGVRRTSEVILFDSDDVEVKTAKSNLYKQLENGDWEIDQELIHRQMSNNSTFYEDRPNRDVWHEHMVVMRRTGEPAFIGAKAARKRRPNFHGGNPCMEILLNNKGLCNLTTNNVFAFVDLNGVLDKDALLEAQRLSARASYRMTCVELELPRWDAVQREERLAGCSITGWQDMVNATKMPIEEQIELLKDMRRVAHEETKKLSQEIGANDSLLVTTVKPEGTLSQLPTVSSGLHYSHSPYYIRRVRITSNDPLVQVCEELGYSVLPEVGQTLENCTTKVIEFPVKSPEGRTKYDVSAIEQLENYKMFMEHYVDHNASITVTVRPHEWDDVEEWVYNNWDDVVAISFLPLEDSVYQLMPYEAITEEEYFKLLEPIKNKHITPNKISKYEKKQEDLDVGNDGCDTNICPVR